MRDDFSSRGSGALGLERSRGLARPVERRLRYGVQGECCEEATTGVRRRGAGQLRPQLHLRGHLIFDAALEPLALFLDCRIVRVDGEGDLALVERLAEEALGLKRL